MLINWIVWTWKTAATRLTSPKHARYAGAKNRDRTLILSAVSVQDIVYCVGMIVMGVVTMVALDKLDFQCRSPRRLRQRFLGSQGVYPNHRQLSVVLDVFSRLEKYTPGASLLYLTIDE